MCWIIGFDELWEVVGGIFIADDGRRGQCDEEDADEEEEDVDDDDDDVDEEEMRTTTMTTMTMPGRRTTATMMTRQHGFRWLHK